MGPILLKVAKTFYSKIKEMTKFEQYYALINSETKLSTIKEYGTNKELIQHFDEQLIEHFKKQPEAKEVKIFCMNGKFKLYLYGKNEKVLINFEFPIEKLDK